jgi:hypothetical protein
MAGPDVPDGIGGLGERVRPIDDRADLPLRGQLRQEREPSLVVVRHERNQPLADKRGKRAHAEQPADRRQPSAGGATDCHEHALRGQYAAALGECAVPADRSCSTLSVGLWAYTRAPSHRAICTAKIPTPPPAPLISTL